MKTAIVGLGNIGSRVARNLVEGGERIIVADRTLAKAERLATALGAAATPMTIAAAVAEAEVVILAVDLDAIKELLQRHRSDLAGKVIVDPSNPIGPDGKGGFRKTIAEDQSSGQLLAALIPHDAELVKAFGTLAAPSLESGANRQPEKAVLFYATDFPEAGRVASRLIAASGFVPVPVGGIDQSRRIEVFGDLHEMGALGKLVGLEEANALV